MVVLRGANEVFITIMRSMLYVSPHNTTTMNRHEVAAFDVVLSPAVISWLSAQPMHVVEHLTS